MVLVSAAVDGVTNIVPGWTDQANTPYSSDLESSGGGSLGITTTPAANGYLGWSLIPEDAIATNTHTSTSGYLVRVTASTGGSCGHLDVGQVSGTFTNTVFALYTGPGFAVGPLVWTADTHAAFTGAGVIPLTWNGASSPATVNLQAGATYWLYYELTGTSPALAGSTGAAGGTTNVMNANLTATASFANNAMTLAAGAPTSITSATTLTPQTSWTNTNLKTWFGLRA